MGKPSCETLALVLLAFSSYTSSLRIGFTQPEAAFQEGIAMYFLIFLGISVLLAIPTYGLSLLFFFVGKNWIDNKAMSSLLGAAVTAMRTEVSEERHHINQAAIRKVFQRFGVSPAQVKVLGDGAVTYYWGVLQHPLINNNNVFSARFAYTPRNGSSNTVFIKAAEGHDPSVLSIDDITDLASGLLGVLSETNYEPGLPVDYVFPKDDEEIRELLCDLASKWPTCHYPNLTYTRMCNFVSRSKFDPEFFEDVGEDKDENEFHYDMRFEFTEAGEKYGVRVIDLSLRNSASSGVHIVSAPMYPE